jgi:hypothetical protein
MQTDETLLEVFDVDLEKGGKRISQPWTSDAGGAFAEAIILRGWLVEIEFIPGTSGSQPSNLYDMTLENSAGRDVLVTPTGTKASIGLDLSNSGSNVYPEPMTGIPIIKYLNGTYTARIANGGNAKSGTIVYTIKNR